MDCAGIYEEQRTNERPDMLATVSGDDDCAFEKVEEATAGCVELVGWRLEGFFIPSFKSKRSVQVPLRGVEFFRIECSGMRFSKNRKRSG